MKCLIVTGGDTSDEFASQVVKNGGYEIIIAADSGMEFLYRVGIVPDIIVGDFDSADADILDFYREQEQIEICVLNPVKDDTDTESAIREAIDRGATNITIIGGTGTRLDHVLGNITLLGIGLEEGVSITLLDPHNCVRMYDRPVTIKKEEQYGQYISVLPYSDFVENVTITGMKYPLNNYRMGGFNSLGVSNEIVDEEAHISFDKGIILLIESRDEY